ncbi:uncharacterized protein LOC112507059 isoform X2 [Cynara cardunculus var. scolymus]|uniref:uncharacterized protein LOC112507059 isoform X2 n=1 Tax=Cynara cardunculus var. scolymus TaxID=59895 RepID=UPI000D62C43F|nr:uncharacterized protein LOC112507059 isoform X2 [Cynara cardunculus var. scolymus]
MGSREQQISKGLQAKVVSLRANRIRKALDYTKLENPLFVGQVHELRKSAGEKHLVHLQPVMNHKEQSLRSMGDKDDSLVKHMKNLPGFLQRVEKGENIQGKALNFGVLDWGRLENWKSNEKRIPPRYNMKTSLSSNNPILVESGSARLSRTRKKIHPPRRDQHASSCSQLNSSCRERLSPGVRWPRGKAVKVQLSESSPGQTFNGTQSPCWKDLPPGNKYDTLEFDSSKEKQTDQMTSEKETSSSDWRKQGPCHSPRYTMRSQAQASATKMPSDDNINHADDPCPSGNHNAVLSSPRDGTKINSSNQDLWLSDSRNSCDGHLTEASQSRLSNCFSPTEFHSPNPFSQVPHSCPFPLPLSTETYPDPECSNEIPVTPMRGRTLEGNEPVVQHSTKKCDVDIDEHPALKGRQSSPNRRFSFSLGKMTRSFSFKESSSVVPQLSSTHTSFKSGPVNFEASPDLVNYNWKKGNATNSSRSSPLRRLLDPLLKLKGSHSADKVQKSKLDQNSTSFSPVKENEWLQSKYRSSNVQALLQLTLKNGIPFFKLVVESSSDILAAAVKKLPSGKDDSSLIYAFYSVHENKKKHGGWIYQGSKEKSFGFGYNIVGQMKICSSYHAEFSGSEKDLYVVRESVLYSSDSVQADERTLDRMLDGEVAAIIVKNPSDEICGDIGSSNSMVVIVPEGAHSLPNGGRPSPLINRWRSGGVCDCGGWDIGCQFHVLSHQNEIPTPSNRLDLCYQGRGKKKCKFSLVSLEDGLYSLEYDPSMSLLQAFSICVAVVSSQKLTHIFQVNYVPDEKVKSWEEIPGKYVSKPPASPVGRV